MAGEKLNMTIEKMNKYSKVVQLPWIRIGELEIGEQFKIAKLIKKPNQYGEQVVAQLDIGFDLYLPKNQARILQANVNKKFFSELNKKILAGKLALRRINETQIEFIDLTQKRKTIKKKKIPEEAVDKINLTNKKFNPYVNIWNLKEDHVYVMQNIQKIVNQFGERVVVLLDTGFDVYLPQDYVKFFWDPANKEYYENFSKEVKDSKKGLKISQNDIEFVNL